MTDYLKFPTGLHPLSRWQFGDTDAIIKSISKGLT